MTTTREYPMMRYIRLSLAAVAALLLAVSCAREQSESYNKLEHLSLEAWMAQNKPELLGNRQGFGNASYYIEEIGRASCRERV